MTRADQYQLVRLRFGERRGLRRAAAVDAIEGLCAELWRAGQVRQGWTVAGDDEGWFVVLTLTRPGALAGRHRSEWAEREWCATAARFGREPVPELLGHVVGPRRVRLADCRRLVLWANFTDADHPVRCFDTGRNVPLLDLPVDATLRRDLLGWASSFRAVDELWFGSDVLERASYTQLAQPASRLSRIASELADALAQAVERPVYRYLVHYDAGDVVAARERCPVCARRWLRRPHGGWNFVRRCDACRLVAH
ncbi:MAG: DUF2310 family Zn-ribbon-containing protein [Planctomycetes bacterium]|nr:DUF2310 family Zn-ribbon-containing protein [Planctomycetota bacterium]